MSSRFGGAVWGPPELLRKDEVARDAEVDVVLSPVDTLVMVKASPRDFSLVSDELDDDEDLDLDKDEELTEEEEEEEGLEGEDEDDLGSLSLLLLLLSFGESDGLEKVGDADFNWVMDGLPRLGCFGLPAVGLGLLRSFGECDGL